MTFFKKQHTVITRAQFEECLQLYFERIQAGTFEKVKEEVGGVWPVIIDDMYKNYAKRIDPDNLIKMIGDCAETLVGVIKRLKTEGN
jgi:hypothetical protein